VLAEVVEACARLAEDHDCPLVPEQDANIHMCELEIAAANPQAGELK